ncbi:Suppressor of SWI4 1 [Wickerhamomyces ciferrii]|uniref:Suppressor of SWI4 1 n=1 Tax=Wickerhamomyces ciferrii (strain ATCC 14091 / BCRC 22168 / CBS 111 / JCM 3599 / NBRC 0793 / NRRL Y-1031 F-60-10) TaxID=1206466 RepID=K0KVU1_WICCF|nr:Suppressor of SWI4 1 [Wickerhamomyces ciferrii]CCH45248.1 Suppressor of SWI4 1 [Wickerhamomyces ciferrii]
MKNHSLTQLVKDMRNVMQPHTALKLRERKSNKLRDFVVMAGPLNVSHLLVFSQSEAGTTQLRLGRMSRGPTITFKVENYSLCKDVRKILRHPKSITKESKEYLNPPLLVLNGFTNPQKAPPHEKLLITTFQNMFPPIQPHSTKVNSVKRVLMINKDPETGHIDLRHYAIDAKPVEGSKSLKKLINAKHNLHKKLPNLGKVSDVSDLVLDPYANGAGFTSDSEVEDDGIVDIKEDNASQLSKQKPSKSPEASSSASTGAPEEEQAPNTRKKAIKLTELGPRMKLTMTKIEEGVCTGKVLYHHNVKKSKAEMKELEAKHAERQKIKDERKRIQSENIASKKAKKDAKKERRQKRKEEREAKGEAGEQSGDSESEAEDKSDDESEDDANDIPEDLDSDLYSEVDEMHSD